MIQAGGRSIAAGADGTAAGAGDAEVACGVLGRSEMPLLRTGQSMGGKERKARKELEKKRRTAAQQNPSQQFSPTAQYELPQHADPVGMQKGAMLDEVGMQHSSGKTCQH